MEVNEFCTCGAKLPDGARFCHKCGKPQFDLLPQEEPETVPAQPAAVAAEAEKPSPAAAAINLRNPFAVRTAFLAGGLAVLFLNIPLPPPLNILWLFVLIVGAGFWSVWLYHRRTGAYLTAGNGARLGTMVGLFAFIIYLVTFTLILLVIETGSMQEMLRKGMEAQNNSPEMLAQFDSLMSSPGALAFMLVLVLTTAFFLLTILGAAGGALGAKVLEKD
jgi:hypothetical protein